MYVEVRVFGGVGGLRYVEAGGFIGVVGWVGDIEDDDCWVSFK